MVTALNISVEDFLMEMGVLLFFEYQVLSQKAEYQVVIFEYRVIIFEYSHNF